MTVGDSGSGMSARTINKIFAPFFTTKGAGAPVLVSGSVRASSNDTVVRCESAVRKKKAAAGPSFPYFCRSIRGSLFLFDRLIPTFDFDLLREKLNQLRQPARQRCPDDAAVPSAQVPAAQV